MSGVFIRKFCVVCFLSQVCLTSYFVFSVGVLSHSPVVVYYPVPSIVEMGVQNSWGCPLLFSNRNRDLCAHRRQKSYTAATFGKLWTTPGVRCILHA